MEIPHFIERFIIQIKLIIEKGGDLFLLNKKRKMGFDLVVEKNKIEIAKLIMNRITNYIIDFKLN